MGRLDNKVALITGASRNVGKGIAQAFSREGARLVLLARNKLELEQAARECGDAVPIAADVTNEQQVQHAFAVVQERFGRLDLLVNNAATRDVGPIEALTVEGWDRVMAANLRGPFLCIREAFRIMKVNGGGRIINISSISALRVRANSAPYVTSKAGLAGLTHAAAIEGREYGIAVSCLFPGNIFVERLRDRNEPFMTVEEFSRIVVDQAGLPAHINMLESVMLPVGQPYLGRG